MNVVVATSNAGKLAELTVLLAPLGVTLASQRQLSITQADETASSFVENALIKARHAAAATGWPAIADDSGLVVPALGGAPGVLSARYAGADANPAANNRKLVAALADIADRRAYFYCALVFMRSADDPAPLIASADWHGRIIDISRGNGGFGYDPHFFVELLAKTAAELPASIKNEISHRGKAAAILVGSIARALESMSRSGDA
ncbi:MAG: RdgB/HAM1 family non-canonical purine NTP pyrophosphatase [Proteobacteria bacterium]|nr:RdgB/HAM1 family non-canonical purine NTP pyrophosphatase [Pseudomonadota bacterium]